MKLAARSSLRWYVPLLFATAIVAIPIHGYLRATPAAQEVNQRPFVVEYYYKAKWVTRTNLSRCSRKTTIRCSRRRWNLDAS
jgi:hypothetical protein